MDTIKMTQNITHSPDMSAFSADGLSLPAASAFTALGNNVYLLAYVSGAVSFWLTTGVFFYLQVYSDKYRDAWKPRGKHGMDSWNQAFRKAAWNLHVSLPAFVAFCAIVSFKVFDRYGIDTSNPKWIGESWTQMAIAFSVMALVDDAVFWGAHRGLHAHPYLFKKIHALHHRFHSPIAPAVFYTHPIDFIASYATEFWVGPVLVYMGVLDIFTVCLYNFVGVAGAVLIHAGIEAKVPFIGLDVCKFHSFHHKMGDSHYGVWGIVDHLVGTGVNFSRLKGHDLKQCE